MQRILKIFLAHVFVLFSTIACDLENTTDPGDIGVPPPPSDGGDLSCESIELSDDEYALYRAIMNERERHGLHQIPLSAALTEVAQVHADDAVAFPNVFNDQCNLHSWNSSRYWKGCCYTADHAKASCMWDKPEEIAGFRAHGYEIAYRGTHAPNNMLDLWLNSPGHRDVILNHGNWERSPWKSIGIGISERGSDNQRFAYVWFSEARDCE